jgi:hypothetical protein
VLSAEVVHDSTGHRCAKHAAALGHGFHCTYDLRLARALQKVAAGAHAECGKHRVIVGEHMSTRIAICGLP